MKREHLYILQVLLRRLEARIIVAKARYSVMVLCW